LAGRFYGGKDMTDTATAERDMARVVERVARINRAVEKFVAASHELRELGVDVLDWQREPFQWRKIRVNQEDNGPGERIQYGTEDVYGILTDAILDGRIKV